MTCLLKGEIYLGKSGLVTEVDPPPVPKSYGMIVFFHLIKRTDANMHIARRRFASIYVRVIGGCIHIAYTVCFA